MLETRKYYVMNVNLTAEKKTFTNKNLQKNITFKSNPLWCLSITEYLQNPPSNTAKALVQCSFSLNH